MKYIDYFAVPYFGGDSDMLYKARLLVGIIFSNLLLIFLFATYFLFFAPLPQIAIFTGVTLILALGAVFSAQLYLLRKRGKYESAAQFVVGSTFMGIIVGVFVSGGPIETPSGMILVLPCILAFCLLGLNAGLFWTVAMFVVNLAGIGFALLGFDYPQVSPPEMEETTRVYNWVVAFLSIIAIVIIYEQMNTRLKQERDAERDRYKHMATHDEMTGLANRKLFNETLKLSLARAGRNEYNISLLMIDLNGFKPINDTLGHEAGDKVLIHVANELNGAIRKTDLAARLGGDEFAVILEGISEEEDLQSVVDKIRAAIATPVRDLDGELSVTGSVGIANYLEQAECEEDLLRKADFAMYYAKKNKIGSRIYTEGDKSIMLDT